MSGSPMRAVMCEVGLAHIRSLGVTPRRKEATYQHLHIEHHLSQTNKTLALSL